MITDFKQPRTLTEVSSISSGHTSPPVTPEHERRAEPTEKHREIARNLASKLRLNMRGFSPVVSTIAQALAQVEADTNLAAAKWHAARVREYRSYLKERQCNENFEGARLTFIMKTHENAAAHFEALAKGEK